MLNEQWTKWKPNISLEGKYNIESFHYKGDETITFIMISAQDKNKKISLYFGGIGLSLRKSNGMAMENKIAFLKDKYGEDFYSEWSFFTVINSAYSNWAAAETCTIYKSTDFIHFAIVSKNSIYESINGVPEIQFIQ